MKYLLNYLRNLRTSHLDPLIKPLTVIVNQMINTGIFSQMLKIAKVVPLYKKGDKNLLINYRPISLLPSISKIFEKIIYIQMYKYFEENNLFFTSQYGFRIDYSTELAAFEVADRIICDMVDRGKIPFNIYLDLSKAFDTIDHKILFKKSDYYGIKGTSLNLIQSYLSNRKQFVNYNNTMSDLLTIIMGVPQGSILGPLLFLIYMNDLNYSSKYFDFIIYVDDTTLSSVLTTFHTIYN